MQMARFLVEAVVLGKQSPNQLVREHPISRSWFYELLARYRRDGPAALEPKSHRPASCPHQIDQAIIEATATDPLVRLTAATFSVNGKKWINVFPADGLFDSKTESFRFKTESLKPGTYVLVMRVQDAAGNVGSGDVVFTVRENQP